MTHETRLWGRAQGLLTDWLISFVAVVDCGGFSRAAEALHKSQSRVSEHVRQLEAHLRVELFDRTQRPARLTDVGRVFLPYARETLGRIETAAAHVRSVAKLEEGVVRVGSYASVSALFLPGVLATFTTEHPHVTFALHELGITDLDAALINDHVGLTIRPRAPDLSDPHIVAAPLWREHINVILPESASTEVNPVEELRQRRVISAGIYRTPDQVSTVQLDGDAALRRAGVEPSEVLYTQHPQALIEFVKAGLGVGVINSLAFAASDSTGTRAIPLEGSWREVIVCWHRDRYLSSAERAFLRLIREAPLPPGVLPMGPPTPDPKKG